VREINFILNMIRRGIKADGTHLFSYWITCVSVNY